jgi:hypothetical protein
MEYFSRLMIIDGRENQGHDTIFLNRFMFLALLEAGKK